MKKLIGLILTVFCIISLIGCNGTDTAKHVHQWQDVSGEHARICTECDEKQLKSEACSFVRISCDQPMECSICHAIGDESVEDHDWRTESREGGCWHCVVAYVCTKCETEQIAEGELVLPDHKWTEESADGKTTFSCTRCKESFTFMSETGEFSYEQVLEEYKLGDPGVKHEGFNNPSTESEMTRVIDVIIRANFELTVDYDTISVSHDEKSDVWRVSFWMLNMDGGCQDVYLNGDGTTCYIVYGE